MKKRKDLPKEKVSSKAGPLKFLKEREKELELREQRGSLFKHVRGGLLEKLKKVRE